MTISVASRKAKARRLQQWCCDKISGLLGIPWGLHEDNEIRSREMGQRGVDVILSPRVREMFPFSIECKNQEKWSIQADVEQAKKNTNKNTDWLLVYKKNGSKPVIVMDADVFFEILKGNVNGINSNQS